MLKTKGQVPKSNPPLAPQPQTSLPKGHHVAKRHPVYDNDHAVDSRWRCLDVGIASLIWLLVRTGTGLRGIVYPCQ